MQNAGDDGESILTATISGNTMPLTALTGWDTWGKTDSSEFVLSEAADVTLTICGTVTKAGYYENLDNIVLYQWKDAPVYDINELATLIFTVPADYLTMGFTADSISALDTALIAANNCTAETDSDTICAAYEALSSAISGLVLDGTVFVQKVENYDCDSIRGVDVSSYLSLMDSFEIVNNGITDESKKAGFRGWGNNLLSKQGFFDLLAASGVNYVRLRVWNEPYDREENGYGGGNNDFAKAVEMG